MSPKLAMALVVVVIVLFVGTISIGLTRGNDDGGSSTPRWVGEIGDSAGLNQPLDPAEDLGASSPSACRGQFIAGELELVSGADCTLLIRGSSSFVPFVRTFTLSVEEGGPARVIVQQPDQVTIKERLNTGAEPEEFDIHDQGATIRVECQAALGGSCLVSVGP